jgi:hypothetical protein
MKAEDLKEGDMIKAKTTWGFPVEYEAEIIGKVIFDKKSMVYCIDGVIKNCERCFPLHDCWGFEKL